MRKRRKKRRKRKKTRTRQKKEKIAPFSNSLEVSFYGSRYIEKFTTVICFYRE